MVHPLTVATDTDQLIPAGWYTVCASTALQAGSLLPFRLAGLSLVAWRTVNGDVAVIDDRCPHMGGRFSQGDVTGDSIRCPIHRFAFAPDGQCTATGFTDVTSRACVRPWPVLDINGLVLVYYHPLGEKPGWQPGVYDWHGWSTQLVRHCDFPATAQLVTEGIADKGHLATVHGYSNISMDRPFSTDGPLLTTGYSFTNSGSLPGAGPLMQRIGRLLPLQLRVQFYYEAWGLGYSFTEVFIPELDVRMRHFVNPTPLDSGNVRLFYSMALGPIDAGAIHPLLKIMPGNVLAHFLFKALYKGFEFDLNDDIAMWSKMQSLEKPQLCKADGPVNKFRRWAEQFYPPGRQV